MKNKKVYVCKCGRVHVGNKSDHTCYYAEFSTPRDAVIASALISEVNKTNNKKDYTPSTLVEILNTSVLGGVNKSPEGWAVLHRCREEAIRYIKEKEDLKCRIMSCLGWSAMLSNRLDLVEIDAEIRYIKWFNGIDGYDLR